MSAIHQSPEWQALAAHQALMSQRRISELFAADPRRVQQFSIEAAGLLLDYSKNLVDGDTMALLLALAERCRMNDAIRALFDGDLVNATERRPALHVALRSPRQDTDYEKQIHQALDKMESFAERVITENWRGHGGKAIADVVNIGIGGSDLGPVMVYEALAACRLDPIRCHFVSNVDPRHLEQTLQSLDPASTLFIISSKSFGTQETILNAQAARDWFRQHEGAEADLARHFIAVTANADKALAFGIDADNIFPLWPWVGGRYSLWSAIGLPLAVGLGMADFRALLAGAHAMDEHFRAAPPSRNLPVILALLDLWHANFFGAETRAILPYSHDLRLLPAYLQQLDMESLGKSVDQQGLALEVSSGGIIWGGAGTNGQHAFHQLLHQGKHLAPVDFIAAASSESAEQERHARLLANCFAQGQALMNGKSQEQVKAELREQGMDDEEVRRLAPHKAIAGNKPSNTILLKRLTARSLGSLLAAYEHKVYARSVILGINAFDQWGVELGKELSGDIFHALMGEMDGDETGAFDASTEALINYCKS